MIKLLDACGIDRFHPRSVDFIGNLDNDAHTEVTRMFDTLGVTQAYPEAKEVVEKYFPKENVGGHSSQSHNKQELFYRNRSTVWAVLNLYAEDYVQLRIKRPAVWEQAVETSRQERFHDRELLTPEDLASIAAIESK